MPWLTIFLAPPWLMLGGIPPSITVCGVTRLQLWSSRDYLVAVYCVTSTLGGTENKLICAVVFWRFKGRPESHYYVIMGIIWVYNVTKTVCWVALGFICLSRRVSQFYHFSFGWILIYTKRSISSRWLQSDAAGNRPPPGWLDCDYCVTWIVIL